MEEEINDGTLSIIQEFKTEKEEIADIFDFNVKEPGNSEVASNSIDETVCLDEKDVIDVKFVDTGRKDCSSSSICTDGEIICELSDINVKVKQEVESLGDGESKVQCKVESVDQDSCSDVKDMF
ncbi:hypothetical protein WDU94_001081 [Cyamophila willieti]